MNLHLSGRSKSLLSSKLRQNWHAPLAEVERLRCLFSIFRSEADIGCILYDLVVRALKSSFDVEREEHAQSLNKVKGELHRLNQRLESLYIDKLDRRISDAYYSRTSSQWKEEARRCEDDLLRLIGAGESYMDEGVSLLTLARDAHVIFEKQQGVAQRKLLNFVFQNCIWKDGQLSANLRQPSDMLEETAIKSSKSGGTKRYDDAGKENWLGN